MDGTNEKIKNFFSNSKVHLTFLTVLSILIIFWKLGEGSLSNPDEAKYAEVAKQILKTDDWISLHFNRMPFLGKPPLYFWLTAITYKFFGISEFTARFWSAAFGVGVVLTTYFLGKELFNKTTGFISALILLTTPQFNNYWSYSNSHSARAVAQDTIVIFFIALAILSFWMGRKESKYLVLPGILMGFGVMAKSIVGLFPLFMILLFVIFAKELQILKNKNLYKGFIGFLVIVIPWHALETIILGWDFLTKFIVKNIVSRATTGIGMRPVSDFFYIDVLKHGFYPWSIFALFALLYVVKNAFEKREKGDILVLCWLSVIFGIFTYAQFKTEHYMMPMYPALSICVGRFFDGFIKGKRDGLILGSMFIAFALWVSLISEVKYSPMGGIGFNLNVNNVDLIQGLAITAAVFFLYSIVGRLGDTYVKFRNGMSLLIVAVILVSAIHFPQVNDFSYDTAKVSPVMMQVSNPDSVLMLYKLTRKYTPTVFYSDRRVWNLHGGKGDKDQIIKQLNLSRTAFALMKLSDYEEVSIQPYKILAYYDDLILITNNNTVSPPQPLQLNMIRDGRLFFTDDEGKINVKKFGLKKTSDDNILEFIPISATDTFDNEGNIANMANLIIVDGGATLSKGSTENFYESLGQLISTTIRSKFSIGSVLPKWNSSESDSNVSITIEISVDNGTTWTRATNGVLINYTYKKENRYLLYKAVFQTSDNSKSPMLHDITLTYEEHARAKAELIEDLKFSKYKLKRGDRVRVNFTVKNTGDVRLEGYLDITDNKKRRIFTDYPKTSYKLYPGEIAMFDHTLTVEKDAPTRKFRVWREMFEKNLKTWMGAENKEGMGDEAYLEIVSGK